MSSAQIPVAIGIAIFVIAFVAGGVWLLVGPEPRLSHSSEVATAVLVVGSVVPLALALNRLITSRAVRRMSEHGRALPDPGLLDTLALASYIIFRKSGIVTCGQSVITDVVPNPHTPVSEALLLQIAASLQQEVGHPWAQALVAEAARRQLVLTAARHQRTISGRGMAAVLAGRRIHLGNRLFMEEQLIRLDALQEAAAALQQQSKTVAYVAVDGEFLGLIASCDNVRPEAAMLVSAFHRLGIPTALVTTDHHGTAHAVARELGIQRVWAEISLPQKAEEIRKLQQAGHTVILVARPGLESSSANVTVLIGSSLTDVLTAHHVMAVEEVGSVGELIVWARTLADIKRNNLILGALFTAVGIPLATGLLYLMFGIVLSLPAAIMIVVVALLVMGLNSLRLVRKIV